MKTKRIILGASILFLSGALMFTSCRKRTTKSAEEPDKETTTVSDNANVEGISNDINSIGGELTESGSLTQFRASGTDMTTGLLSIAPCATITGLTTNTITVDFGTTGCDGADKRVRKGKLFFDLSQCTPASAKYYRNPGFKAIVTSLNYSVDDNLVNITNKTITNTTPASVSGQTVYSGTNLTWNISANISITKPNGGGSFTWQCNRNKELVNSNDPTCYKGQLLAIDWSKAKVKINGTANGTNTKGESYTVVATDLVKDFTCSPSALYPKRHPFISGKLDYKPGNRPTRYFDYGSGACDLNATVTINGVTYSITLP